MSDERIGEFVKIGDVLWRVIAKSIAKSIEREPIYVPIPIKKKGKKRKAPCPM